MTDLNNLIAEMTKKSNEGRSSAGGGVQYMKDGLTVIKLVSPKGREWNKAPFWWEAYDSVDMNGKPTKSYLVTGLIVQASAENVADKENIRYLKVPWTVITSIITQLQAEWPLFEDESNLVEINRKKVNGKTQYVVGIYAQKGKTIKYTLPDDVNWPELDINEAADKESEKDMSKSSSNVPKFTKSVVDDDSLPF